MGRVTPFFGAEKSWGGCSPENITERKVTEEALRDQKVLLRPILGQTADAIIVCDDKGRFTFANAAGEEDGAAGSVGTTLDIPRRCGGSPTTPTAAAYPGRNGLYPGPCAGDDGRHGGPLGKT